VQLPGWNYWLDHEQQFYGCSLVGSDSWLLPFAHLVLPAFTLGSSCYAGCAGLDCYPGQQFELPLLVTLPDCHPHTVEKVGRLRGYYSWLISCYLVGQTTRHYRLFIYIGLVELRTLVGSGTLPPRSHGYIYPTHTRTHSSGSGFHDIVPERWFHRFITEHYLTVDVGFALNPAQAKIG